MIRARLLPFMLPGRIVGGQELDAILAPLRKAP